MEKSVNVNFHMTFRPEVQYISSILDIADNTGDGMTVKEISASTGIPNGEDTGKVEPHINYANYMGLVNHEKKNGKIIINKTSLGKTISIEDPGLQEKLTLLLCHSMMLRKEEGAAVWYSSFREIIPDYNNKIKRESLIKELSLRYEKVNTKNFSPFTTSYDEMFSGLEILKSDSETIQCFPMKYDNEFVYLYAYVLFTYWDEVYSKEMEISSLELEKLNFGKCFCWNRNEEYEVLEKLSDKGLIRLNRQLMPYTVLRLADKEELLAKLFSELC